MRELGFDACVDYQAAGFKQRLQEAVPDGIDVYFENVGGPVGDACFALLNPFGVDGLLLPFQLVSMSANQFVLEWQSPDFQHNWGLELWIALILQVPWRQRLDVFVIGFIIGLVVSGVAVLWGLLLSQY